MTFLRIVIPLYLFLFEHDLFGKPVPTFPDHALAVGEAPSRSAKPATLVGNLLIAVEPRHLLPAALGEGFGQRAFRYLVTASGAGKDRNRRNPVRQIIPGPTLDAKHRAGLRHSLQRLRTKALVRRHRQDQAPAIGEAVEPAFGWPGAAGVDVNDIGFIERNQRAVAFDDFDVWVACEIGFGARSELGFIFYTGDPA